MGCMASRVKVVKTDKQSESLPQNFGLSREMQSGKGERRKSSGIVETEADFWGTVPFYVLKNRIRLLSFEVKDIKQLTEISNCIYEILGFFINCNSEVAQKLEISDKKFEWIHKYEQGFKVIRAIGLNEEKGSLVIMERVVQDHLKTKLKEAKFVFSGLVGSHLTNKTI